MKKEKELPCGLEDFVMDGVIPVCKQKDEPCYYRTEMNNQFRGGKYQLCLYYFKEGDNVRRDGET